MKKSLLEKVLDCIEIGLRSKSEIIANVYGINSESSRTYIDSCNDRFNRLTYRLRLNKGIDMRFLKGNLVSVVNISEGKVGDND